jgi:ABC-type enterochelin transport system substrate-binding protein
MFEIRKIVSEVEEKNDKFDIVGLRFAEAYDELRKACPNGNLVIHLYVETDSIEDKK